MRRTGSHGGREAWLPQGEGTPALALALARTRAQAVSQPQEPRPLRGRDHMSPARRQATRPLCCTRSEPEEPVQAPGLTLSRGHELLKRNPCIRPRVLENWPLVAHLKPRPLRRL